MSWRVRRSLSLLTGRLDPIMPEHAIAVDDFRIVIGVHTKNYPPLRGV
jgi:hypothetical protein